MKIILSIKRNGKYKTQVREFSNQQHLDNYILYVEKKGGKVIGHEVVNKYSTSEN